MDHVELDIKEMLELGKKAATTRKSRSSVVDGEVTSIGSRCVGRAGHMNRQHRKKNSICISLLITYYTVNLKE